MIDLEELTFDEDFAQAFTILRSQGTWARGGWQESARQQIPAVGIITPASAEDLLQVPEGDRVAGSMLVSTATRLYRSHSNGINDDNSGTSDLVVWHGDTYRVSGVWPWVDQGFWKAVFVRVKGA